MSQQIYDAISLQKWSLFSRDVVFRPKSLLVKEKWFIWWYPHYPNPCPSFNRGHILPYHAWTEIEHSRELLFHSRQLKVCFKGITDHQNIKCWKVTLCRLDDSEGIARQLPGRKCSWCSHCDTQYNYRATNVLLLLRLTSPPPTLPNSWYSPTPPTT